MAMTNNDIRDNRVKNELNRVKDGLEQKPCEDAIKTVSRWIKTDMTLGSSLFEMMMNEIHAIPEQEIVKPYLEKLKAEIRKLDDINPDFPMDRTIHISRNEVFELIDNLLSEQEVK